jgi:hypothetical protein
LVARNRTWNGECVPTVYRTLLAVRPDLKGQSLGRQLVGKTRRFVHDHLKRGLIFGFIESDNTPSLRLAHRVGYEPSARIALVNFARTRPRHVLGVRRLRVDEAEPLRERLERLYAGHQLADFELSLRPEQCWGLERAGRLVAALQAEPRRIELTDLGYGGLLKRALPWIPVLRTLVDPSDYRFLWFQHIWFAEDRTEDCYDLMEGVLHAEGYRLANLQWDLASPVYRTWKRVGRLGPLAAFGYRFRLMAERVELPRAEGPCVMTISGV